MMELNSDTCHLAQKSMLECLPCASNIFSLLSNLENLSQCKVYVDSMTNIQTVLIMNAGETKLDVSLYSKKPTNTDVIKMCIEVIIKKAIELETDKFMFESLHDDLQQEIINDLKLHKGCHIELIDPCGLYSLESVNYVMEEPIISCQYELCPLEKYDAEIM